MSGFSGQVAFITGAAHGQGRAVALAFAAQGARIAAFDIAKPLADPRYAMAKSFFGADRDAGRRVHHGIDIFAPRGTPVVAATDGVVRSIASNRLGGHVVWLRDERRGRTLYYAHLDRHAVSTGQMVRTGDVLGFVGNTGNASTTRPHLHFGLYRRGEGPVDPWPWVRLVPAAFPRISADTSRLGSRGRVTAAAGALLLAPSTTGGTLRQVTRGTAVRVKTGAGSAARRRAPHDHDHMVEEIPSNTARHLSTRHLLRDAEPSRTAR